MGIILDTIIIHLARALLWCSRRSTNAAQWLLMGPQQRTQRRIGGSSR